MSKPITRRQATGRMLAGVVSVAVTSSPIRDAVAQKKVDPNGALAKGLSYVEDGSGSARASGDHRCATCLQYTADSDGWGACNIFSGDLVAGNGWCSAFVKRA